VLWRPQPAKERTPDEPHAAHATSRCQTSKRWQRRIELRAAQPAPHARRADQHTQIGKLLVLWRPHESPRNAMVRAT
jgi:hypothetical protein